MNKLKIQDTISIIGILISSGFILIPSLNSLGNLLFPISCIYFAYRLIPFKDMVHHTFNQEDFTIHPLVDRVFYTHDITKANIPDKQNKSKSSLRRRTVGMIPVRINFSNGSSQFAVAVATAVCHPNDSFQKKYGRNLVNNKLSNLSKNNSVIYLVTNEADLTAYIGDTYISTGSNPFFSNSSSDLSPLKHCFSIAMRRAKSA